MAYASNAAAQGTGRAEPGIEEQQKILSAMRQYGEQYVSRLPNFLCSQVTRQFESGRKAEKWKPQDVLTYRLAFVQEREQRKLELVNGKPVQAATKRWRTPLVTEGEFGILLDRVLGPDSSAVFKWKGRDTIRGKTVAVFDYSVDKEHSTLKLSLSDLAKAVVPYAGSIFADPESGAVLRITDTASDIPPELETREISTTIDYGEVSIGGAPHLLPVGATIEVATRTNHIRNELEFRDYRKFEAESTITFGDASDTAPKN